MLVASRARMRRVAAISRIAALVLVAGCARAPQIQPPVSPPTPPTTPSPIGAIPGYEGLVDSLDRIDASGLAGRKIAIDPGHGGTFRGALGVHGLTEAEVNLSVGLRLRDLLAAKGATVFMTRDRDRDFLTPADSSLRGDLNERARLANAFGPDLFLSIHHNADAGGAHNVNETQTYYKLGDSGPSLDAAQDVHRGLVRNVGIRPHKVVPGNYSVLRNSDAPGLLTETSYITNPAVEERLRLPENQELEAEALYVGLARYFARHVPVIESFTASDPATLAEDTLFVDGEPALAGTVRGDFDDVTLEVDGAPVTPERSGARITWRPLGLWSPGRHDAVLRVRLSGVGAARERHLHFEKRCLPSELTASAWPSSPSPGALYGVRVEVRDAEGRLCPDSMAVRVRATARIAGAVARETLATARDGIAWAYFRMPIGVARPGALPAATVRATLVEPVVRGLPVTRAARRVKRDTVVVTASGTRRARGAPWTGFVLAADGEPLRDAPGTREPARAVGWLTRDGFAVLERDSAGATAVPRLAGYRRVAADSGSVPRFVAVVGGALAGRRITLDPEGGGDDAAGIGPSGTRAANLNLEVTRILAAYLEGAGAVVHLTREGDFAVTEVERVQGSESFGAERYLRVGHRLRRFGYYYASAAGKTWAIGAASVFASLQLTTPFYGEEAQYPLQQTSCPALYASPARVDSAADEEALLAPGALRAEAYALFVTLAREWAPRHAWPIDSLEVHGPDGVPVPGAIVTLGGALTLETDRLGRTRFAHTEPGPLEAVLDDRGMKARAVLLDSSRGVVLTGARGN